MFSQSSCREKKTTKKNKLKRMKQNLKAQRQFEKSKPKLRRTSISKHLEWKKLQNQYFLTPEQQSKNKLQNLTRSQKFLQSWEGFQCIELEAIQQFSLNFDSKILPKFNQTPEQMALKVLFSFAYHRDQILIPRLEELVGKVQKNILDLENLNILRSQEQEQDFFNFSLIHEYYEKQTLSRIVRLLHDFFSEDYEEDVLYRESDQYNGNCNVCLSSSDSSANQIIPCTRQRRDYIRCGLRVHQSCYGIRLDQVQTFACNKCVYLEEQKGVEKRLEKEYLEVKQMSPETSLREFYFDHVKCSICEISGGAMVHDKFRQEWYHVLCVLLNSTRYRFKELSRIQSTRILRINEVSEQLTCPSDQTFISAEAETCWICNKNSGEIVCIEKHYAHIMCCVLRGMQMKIQLTDGRIEVKSVEEEEDQYKQQEFEARQDFYRVEKFPARIKN